MNTIEIGLKEKNLEWRIGTAIVQPKAHAKRDPEGRLVVIGPTEVLFLSNAGATWLPRRTAERDYKIVRIPKLNIKGI